MSKHAKSDPFASRLCDRPLCKVCTSTNSRGGCKQASIGYTLSCDSCSENDIEATYHGETSKSAFERGNQHSKGLLKKSEDNPIWKHAELHHDSDNQISFSMGVTGHFSKPMVRQENEAIRIRESMAKHEMNSCSEFHQPVIIRLVPTSSNSQSDQTGAPAVIMDSRYNKKDKHSLPLQLLKMLPLLKILNQKNLKCHQILPLLTKYHQKLLKSVPYLKENTQNQNLPARIKFKIPF